MKKIETSKQDMMNDKKAGYKENSKKDKGLDKKQLSKMRKAYNKK